MEYTKDMILGVRYDEVHNTLKGEKQRGTSRFLLTIKKHKLMTAVVILAIFFICIDMVLVTNFFRVLSTL